MVTVSEQSNVAGGPRKDSPDAAELKRTEQRLLAQYSVNRILAESSTLEEAAPEILHSLCETLGWDVGLLWAVDRAGARLRLLEARSAFECERFIQASRRKVFGPGVGLPGRVWSSGKPIWVADLAADDNFPRGPVAAKVGLISGFAIPVRQGSEVLAVIECFSRERREADALLLAAMGSLGNQIGLFVERMRVEEALRGSEGRYRELVEALGLAVYTTDAQGRITLYNEAAMEFWGRRPETGKDQWCGSLRLFWNDGTPMPLDECPMAIALKEGRPVRGMEAIVERPDGSRRNFTPYPTPLLDESGNVVGGVNVLVDITERKRAEEELRERDERMRLAMEAGGLGSWEWNMGTGEVVWSETLERIHGIREGSFGGTFEAYLADVHPEDRDALIRTIQESVARGTHQVEYRIVRPDSAVRWVSGIGRVTTVGGVRRMMGVCLDITERKEAEKTQGRLATIVESSDDCIISKTLDGTILTWNAAAERVLGYSAAEVIGKSITLLIPPERLAEEEHILSRLRAGEPFQHFETVRVTKDGRRLDVSLTVSPVRNAAGTVIGASKILRDITERKRAEDRERFLSEAISLFAGSLDFDTVLERVAAYVVGTIADWCAIDLLKDDGTVDRPLVAHRDPAKAEIAVRLREFAPHQEAARTVARALQRGASVLQPALTDEHLAGAATSEKHLRIMRDLGFRSAMVVPLLTRERLLGAITFVTAESGRNYTPDDLSLAQDIASRAALAIENARLYRESQEVQEQLRRANDAKDEFLGMVSHELRTPITTIYGGARLLRSRSQSISVENREEILTDIEHETERLHRLVEDLLVLARLELGQDASLEPVLLKHIFVRVAKAFTQRNPTRPLNVVGDNFGPVLGDATYMEQVLRNLLSNAEKYGEPHSPIEIHAEADGVEARVYVLDRGPGIPAEEADVIFDRFYRSPSTSPTTRGIGLGLAVCKRLVEVQGGRIWARARVGGGLEVGFAVPLYREEES